jgi:hypothetical protein
MWKGARKRALDAETRRLGDAGEEKLNRKIGATVKRGLKKFEV